MNNFRQIFEEYKDSFLKENSCVWKQSLKPLFGVVKDGEIETSELPYIMDSAEDAFVICQYTYTVITMPDTGYFFLNMNKQGKIDNAIAIDDWIIKFETPKPGPVRSKTKFYITKNNLKIEIYLNGSEPNVHRIWKLFRDARRCTTQLELDYLKKLYEQEIEIEELTKKIAEMKNNEALLEERIESYRGLLMKIQEFAMNTYK